jgi:hypothetical protein
VHSISRNIAHIVHSNFSVGDNGEDVAEVVLEFVAFVARICENLMKEMLIFKLSSLREES